MLVDEEVYAVTNRWRVQRGLPPLKRDVDEPNPAGSLGPGVGRPAEALQTAPQDPS